MKFQYLTFDCYGTLIDWRKGIEAHLGELLRKNGVVSKKKIFPIYVKFEAEEESDSKLYREVLKNTAMRIASHFGISVPEKQAEEFAKTVPHWTPFSDTTETLKENLAWMQEQMVELGQIPKAGDVTKMVNGEIRAEALRRIDK